MLEAKIIKIDENWSVVQFVKADNLKDNNYFEWSEFEGCFFTTNKIFLNKYDYKKPFLTHNDNLPILQDLLNKINNEHLLWRAKCREIYYYIDNFGTVNYSYDTYSTTDDIRYNLGNYFETKEKGEKVVNSQE